jgi:hypothetical protein
MQIEQNDVSQVKQSKGSRSKLEQMGQIKSKSRSFIAPSVVVSETTRSVLT